MAFTALFFLKMYHVDISVSIFHTQISLDIIYDKLGGKIRGKMGNLIDLRQSLRYPYCGGVKPPWVAQTQMGIFA